MLELLQDHEGPFKCRDGRSDTILHSEIGFSKALLSRGYGLESLMKRYEGLAFSQQDKSTWGCNGLQNPTTEDTLYDGSYVSAMEGMFVKVKASFLAAGNEFATSTVAFHQWQEAADAGDASGISGTRYQHASAAAALAISEAQSKGLACFDFDYYISQNGWPSGAKEVDHKLMFQHFVYVGQFLDYAFQWTC